MERLEDIAELVRNDEIIMVYSQSKMKGKQTYCTVHGYVTDVVPDYEPGAFPFSDPIRRSILSLRDMYMLPVGLDMETSDTPEEMIEIFRHFLKPSHWGPDSLEIYESTLASYKLYLVSRNENMK
jgi:hypothetical protein